MDRLVAEIQDAAAYQRFRLIEAMAKLQGIQPYMVAARSLGLDELRNGIITELSHLTEAAVEKLQSLATEVLLQLVRQNLNCCNYIIDDVLLLGRQHLTSLLPSCSCL